MNYVSPENVYDINIHLAKYARIQEAATIGILCKKLSEFLF